MLSNRLDVALGLFALLVLFGLVALAMRWRRRPAKAPVEELPTLNVEALPQSSVPESGPQLEIYHLPMRWIAAVIAPAGRQGELPPPDAVAASFDLITPGLTQIFRRDQPTLLRWPAQLSAEGFARTFFRCVKLPGDRGKGTPLCSLAGRIETPDGALLVGLVCRADRNNSLGQIMIDQSSKWLDVIRIRQ